MKRTERMLKNASTRCVLSSLFCTDEDKAKLKQDLQVWVGLKFALKNQQNVGRHQKKVKGWE
jgi:hypothetical protein